MKNLILIISFFLYSEINFAQSASDYFTVDPGFRWQFVVTPLDSLNNEIDTLKYHRWDLFISESEFEGLPAKILQTKSGPAETIEYQPYLDSIFYHLSGSEGYEYFKLGIVENLLILLDSLITDSTFNVVSFFESLEQWYSVYRFSQSVGDDYTIFQIDTSLTINATTYPIRLKYLGKRLADETITTGIGTFNCKKFVRTIGVSYLIVLPPPLPPLEVPILSLHDYIWIAENFWIVQGMIPATPVDLNFIGFGAFYIPGLSTKLDKVTGIEDEDYFLNDFVLLQNYPNPFNPSTTISFSVTSPSITTLKIFNSLGEEVAVLINKELTTGSYEIEWNAGGLPSGIYFYQLRTGALVETKKMIFIK